MKFKPGFRALSVGVLALIVSLYCVVIATLFIIYGSATYRMLTLSGIGAEVILAIIYVTGTRLVVFATKKSAIANIEAVFSNMSIDFRTLGNRIILDRSGIETKVNSIGFLSLVGITKGKKGARDYLTSVIKKYINYRFIKESPNV